MPATFQLVTAGAIATRTLTYRLLLMQVIQNIDAVVLTATAFYMHVCSCCIICVLMPDILA